MLQPISEYAKFIPHIPLKFQKSINDFMDAKLAVTLAASILVYYSYSALASRRTRTTATATTMATALEGPTTQPFGGTAAANEASTSAYEPSVADVLVTKAMLNKALRLPPELINTIIDFAEYWPHTSSVTEAASGGTTAFIVRSRAGEENKFLVSSTGSSSCTSASMRCADTNHLQLRCPPLGMHRWPRGHGDGNDPPPSQAQPRPQPVGEEFSADDFQELVATPISLLSHPCRRIIFTIQSHDQGWGGDLGDRGTYRGSWTWFEAGLERWCKTSPAEQAQQPERPSLRVEDLCTVLPEVDWDPSANAHVFKQELLPRENLKIQANQTATRDTQVHRVVWSYTDDIDPNRDTEAAEQQLKQKGRGSATGNGKFVRDLKLGDVVTVWGMARFPQWVNHVESIKVDVYYAV